EPLADRGRHRGLLCGPGTDRGDIGQHERQPADAAVHPVPVPRRLGLGRSERDPHPALVVPHLVEHPSPRRLGELAIALVRGHSTKSAVLPPSSIAGIPNLRWSHDRTRSTSRRTTTRFLAMNSTNGFISSEYSPL